MKKTGTRIEKDFEDFSRELPGKAEEIEKRMETLNADIVIGMKYLYSNMPYSDVGNYTFDTYLDYVQQGIWLWENSPYVKKYPELYFLNYVLFHRTNDEEIKPCRTYFWEKDKGPDPGHEHDGSCAGDQPLVRWRSDVSGNGYAYRLCSGNLQKRCGTLR